MSRVALRPKSLDAIIGSIMVADSVPQSSLNVLVVDDETNIRKALSACLEADGHHVITASSASEAMDLSNRRSFDLAFVDLLLGKDAGIDLVPRLLVASPWIKIVVITAYASVDTAVESMKRGAMDYLPKPFTPAQVTLLTQKVAHLKHLEQKVARLEDALGQAGPSADLSSVSPAMQRAVALARQVANSSATVLIRGESGTGKGVIARAMHSWSDRSDKPFALISCPSLSAQLLESELFGHVKGAFTGAVRDNPGRIAASEGGTLFLDEIADLPAPLQPKLLRFIQDREYERVGDHITRKSDLRVLAATNVNLEQAVAEGRFREDLFYRLNVIQIVITPLRARIEDLPQLAHRLLMHFAAENRSPVVEFAPSALAALSRYQWPGNVRELRNVIERAAILCRGNQVQCEHLLLGDIDPAPRPPAVGDQVTLEQIEEMHIRGVLASTGSIERASEVLGMDTVTLWRRRKKYGI